MDFQIKGKTALVFGGAGGLGSSIALALGREGCQVAIADINSDGLDAVVQRLRTRDALALPIVWDLADLSVLPANLELIAKTFGPVDILVNNTGGPPPSPVSGIDAAAWATSFQKMVQPVITITDHVLEGMRARKWGRVITSASSGVIAPIPNLGVSTRCVARSSDGRKPSRGKLPGDGITVNVVVPGRIATDRIQFLDAEKGRGRRPPRAPEASRSR